MACTIRAYNKAVCYYYLRFIYAWYGRIVQYTSRQKKIEIIEFIQ